MTYIERKLGYLIKNKKEPLYEGINLVDFIKEFDYATKYLSRFVKVRAFTMYLMLFKKAYFEEGKRVITVKLSELGKDFLSDIGRPMSHDVIKRGLNDLLRLKVICKKSGKPGQINQYEVKLPTEIREVKNLILEEMKKKHNKKIIDNKIDYYTELERRLEILKRDKFRCLYCLKELDKDNFYIDHIKPRSIGGTNYKNNLVTCCKSCNSRKNNEKAIDFLLLNYRKGLLMQKEFEEQKHKVLKLQTYKD